MALSPSRKGERQPHGDAGLGEAHVLSSIRETPLKGALLNPTYGSLKRDLIERVYVPKGPPNPNSQQGRLSGLSQGVQGFRLPGFAGEFLLSPINLDS